jgi:lipoprotein NlpD
MRLRLIWLLTTVWGTSACTVMSMQEAPIVDRSGVPARPAAGVPAVPVPPVISGREARDGVYVVQRGDTLFSIALAFGQDFRDLARWNALEDPSRIQVGQSLRIDRPPGDVVGGPGVVTAPVVVAGALETRPLAPVSGSAPPPAGVPTSPGSAAVGSAQATTGAPTAGAPVPVVPPIVAAGAPPTATAAAPGSALPATVASLNWAWPAEGPVIEAFHEARNKGIDIGAPEGAPVAAAHDGQVVYVGNGLRGYGNLLIIKHTDDFVTAYAHNRSILVKQGQSVRRGERVAEVGRTDADSPRLHFEIRRQGKPVDPLGLLPAR